MCTSRLHPQSCNYFSILAVPRRSRRLGGCLSLLIATLAATGCQPTAPPQTDRPGAINRPLPASRPTAGDPAVATVNGVDILQSQFYPPLAEAYGMPMLLNLVQVTLAKQLVNNAGITVTPADVQTERDQTLLKMFGDAPRSDYDTLFQQLLTQQKLSKVEFDFVIETNTYLRKFATPQLVGKISDDDVKKAYSQLYGENRQIRDMELTNMREVGEAKRRLATGMKFAEVATAMSADPHTQPLGGELPPFSLMSPNVPEAIKKMAFTLQVGQVSDTIVTGNGYHLIELFRIIPPKVIKFEDVKDSVRRQLENEWMELSIKSLRNQLGQIALQTLQVNQPQLARQWQAKVDSQRVKMEDRDTIREKMNSVHSSTTQATTLPVR